MSREIKFRAWDKVLKRWCKGSLCMRIDGYGLDSNRYELMQYTGLNDENGVQIYEGDVMALAGSDMLFVVKYNLNKFVLDGCVTLDEVMYFYERKVIGKIYENPELLGTEK